MNWYEETYQTEEFLEKFSSTSEANRQRIDKAVRIILNSPDSMKIRQFQMGENLPPVWGIDLVNPRRITDDITILWAELADGAIFLVGLVVKRATI